MAKWDWLQEGDGEIVEAWPAARMDDVADAIEKRFVGIGKELRQMEAFWGKYKTDPVRHKAQLDKLLSSAADIRKMAGVIANEAEKSQSREPSPSRPSEPSPSRRPGIVDGPIVDGQPRYGRMKLKGWAGSQKRGYVR